MKITLVQLRKKRACASQLAKFESLFGDSVVVTRELCIRHAADFDFDWAAEHLLSAPAWAEYRRARAPALVEYRRARAPAFFDAARGDHDAID